MEDLLKQILSNMATKSDIEEIYKEMRQGFKDVDKRFESIDKRFDDVYTEMRQGFKDVDKRFESIDKRFDDVYIEMRQGFKDINVKIDDIKKSVQRIEENQPDDIYALLKTISDKIDNRNSEIEVLNKRMFKVEAVIERLTN